MTFNKKLTVAAIALLGMVSYISWSGNQVNKAPDVALQLINEGPTSLSKLRENKQLLLVFWATDCVPCVREVPTLIRLHQNYSGVLTIVAVAMAHDPPDRVWQFMRDRSLPYKVSLDLNGNVAQAFGVESTPSLFLIDGAGHVIFTHSGRLKSDRLEALIEKQLHREPV